MFTLSIKTGNDAFEGGAGRQEVARILRETAERVERGIAEGPVRDVNGNTVGGFVFEKE